MFTEIFFKSKVAERSRIIGVALKLLIGIVN